MKNLTRQEETRALKAAFFAVGIKAEVGHGHGTAWSWLYVNIGDGSQFGPHDHYDPFEQTTCGRCIEQRALSNQVQAIIDSVTGRDGEYNGHCNIMAQDPWCSKCTKSYKMHLGCDHIRVQV